MDFVFGSGWEEDAGFGVLGADFVPVAGPKLGVFGCDISMVLCCWGAS